MRKYWYYTYEVKSAFGCGVDFSDSGEFDLCEITKAIMDRYKKNCVITNWKEISSTQFEKLSKYFENQNK